MSDKPDVEVKKPPYSHDPKDWTPREKREYAQIVADAHAEGVANPDWSKGNSETNKYYRPPKERGHCEGNGSTNGSCGCPLCTGARRAAEAQSALTGYVAE